MEQAFFGASIAIFGVLIGALSTIYSARLTAHRHQLYLESVNFRAEFVTEVIRLRSASEDAFRIIDNAALAKHKKAKVLYEPWIIYEPWPWIKRKRMKDFNRAWQKYENSIKTTAPGSIDRRRIECDSVLADIEALLSYAKYSG